MTHNSKKCLNYIDKERYYNNSNKGAKVNDVFN